LTVAPAEGYQFKSITAAGARYGVEDFNDLVALMGDAVFEGDERSFDGYTCKIEDGKFVVYDGTTLVRELSESNITNADSLSSPFPTIYCDNARWYFHVSNGKIVQITGDDTSSWDRFFFAESEST